MSTSVPKAITTVTSTLTALTRLVALRAHVGVASLEVVPIVQVLSTYHFIHAIP